MGLYVHLPQHVGEDPADVVASTVAVLDYVVDIIVVLDLDLFLTLVQLLSPGEGLVLGSDLGYGSSPKPSTISRSLSSFSENFSKCFLIFVICLPQ